MPEIVEPEVRDAQAIQQPAEAVADLVGRQLADGILAPGLDQAGERGAAVDDPGARVGLGGFGDEVVLLVLDEGLGHPDRALPDVGQPERADLRAPHAAGRGQQDRHLHRPALDVGIDQLDLLPRRDPDGLALPLRQREVVPLRRREHVERGRQQADDVADRLGRHPGGLAVDLRLELVLRELVQGQVADHLQMVFGDRLITGDRAGRQDVALGLDVLVHRLPERHAVPAGAQRLGGRIGRGLSLHLPLGRAGKGPIDPFAVLHADVELDPPAAARQLLCFCHTIVSL